MTLRSILLVALLGLSTLTMQADETFPPIAQQWEDAFNRADAPSLLKLYTTDATVLPPHQPMASGYEAVRKVMEAHAAAKLKVYIGALETTGFGELAYQLGTWTIKNPEGKELDHGKFIQIWKKVDGSWKIYRDIWNSDTEMKPPA